MATTQQIDDAMTALRSARLRVANAVVAQAGALQARDTAAAALALANSILTTARADATAAKTALRDLLAQPET